MVTISVITLKPERTPAPDKYCFTVRHAVLASAFVKLRTFEE